MGIVPPVLSLPSPASQTWYLLVELKGISATLGFRSLILRTEPQESSMHLSSADSEASPAVSRWRGVSGQWEASSPQEEEVGV